MANYFAPRVSEDTKLFFDNIKEHKLVFQKCKKCGKLRWPASYLCPSCLSEEVEEVELKGTGTIYSIVKFHKPFHPSIADKVPYLTAEIDLDEGVRIIANVISEEAKIGDKVKATYEDFEDYSKVNFEVIK